MEMDNQKYNLIISGKIVHTGAFESCFETCKRYPRARIERIKEQAQVHVALPQNMALTIPGLYGF